MTFNERLELAGIKTIREVGKDVMLEYKGKVIKRPHVNSIEKTCLKQFNITI